MNVFLCMPEAPLLCILMDWLALKDLVRLDSAACNRTSRAELHQLFISSPIPLSQILDDQIAIKAQWISKRGIKCKDVCLRIDTDHSQLLQEKMITQSGSLLLSLHLILLQSVFEKETIRYRFDRILHSISTVCTSLRTFHLSCSVGTFLTSEHFLSLEKMLERHPALQHLMLTSIGWVPLSLVERALLKMKSLTLEKCGVYEEETQTAIGTENTQPKAILKSIYSSLPTQLCVYATDLIHCIRLEDGNNATQFFTKHHNVRRANLIVHFDCNFAPHICQYWKKLVYLRLRKQQINETTTLILIKGIPTLRLLDTIGDIPKSNNDDVDSDCSASGVSALRVLYMHCNDSSTLNEILKLCPNLTSLSLYQPKRPAGVPVLYVPVEKSLSLLRVCIHQIRALYLTDYTDLTNEDVMALHTTQLHTLSITNAGRLLNDEAIILELVPTLPLLHTFVINRL